MGDTPTIDDASPEDRLAYLTVVASIASADSVVSGKETDALRELCRAHRLDDDATQRVVSVAQNRRTEEVESALARLRDSPLRFTLMTDCLHLAYADDTVVVEEEQALAELAGRLKISEPQMKALRESVEAVRAAQRAGASDHELEKLGERVGARLAAVGVPVGALAIGGALGAGVAGMSTGVAALGLGLGVASGFGVALGVGIGTIYGVRWLHDKIRGR